MSRQKEDGMSVEEMRRQIAMHMDALAALQRDIVNEHRYYPRLRMEGTIEYHKYRISNYESMIKKEEQL